MVAALDPLGIDREALKDRPPTTLPSRTVVRSYVDAFGMPFKMNCNNQLISGMWVRHPLVDTFVQYCNHGTSVQLWWWCLLYGWVRQRCHWDKTIDWKMNICDAPENFLCIMYISCLVGRNQNVNIVCGRIPFGLFDNLK